MPAAFGKIHPRWQTPYVSILVQAVISGVILLLSQINESTVSAYQILVDAAVIVYFIPFLYMYAAAITAVLSQGSRGQRPRRADSRRTSGSMDCRWTGISGDLLSIVLSLIPPGDTANKFMFELKLVCATAGAILLGLFLYARGARQKRQEAAAAN